MAEEQEWYYMNGEEQLGPVSPEGLQQLAAAGQLLPETPVWTEGLEEWAQASQVEGLFPEPAPEPAHPHLVVGAEAQTAHPLAGEIVPGQAAAPVVQAAPAAPQIAGIQPAQQAQPVGYPQAGYQAPGQQPGAAMPGMVGATAVQPGEEYPAPGNKRASYGLLLTFMLGGILILAIGLIVGGKIASGGSDEEVTTGAIIILATSVVGYLMCLVAIVLTYIFLFRAWNCLRFGAPRTTPGKAVGFLFIPLFSIYWVFVALYGLAQDWNRIMASHPNLQAAPRMSSGLFLAFLIFMLSGIGAPIGVILWFIVFKQICNGINFMGRLHLAQAQPRPGGLQFY